MMRNRWARTAAAAGVLVLGAACGGAGDASSSASRGARGGRPPEAPAPPAPGQAQQVIASRLPTGEGAEAIARRGPNPAAPAVPQPPPPDLGTQRPTPPPNTMSLETLHQQGKTHVLR
jgi:hypothetical protein